MLTAFETEQGRLDQRSVRQVERSPRFVLHPFCDLDPAAVGGPAGEISQGSSTVRLGAKIGMGRPSSTWKRGPAASWRATHRVECTLESDGVESSIDLDGERDVVERAPRFELVEGTRAAAGQMTRAMVLDDAALAARGAASLPRLAC